MELIQAISMSVFYGLFNPIIIVAAVVVGLLVRSWRQVAVAVVLVGVALLAFSMLVRLPEGAQPVWEAAPFGLIPPAFWASLTFWLRRGRGTVAPPGTRRIVLLVLGMGAGGIFGAILGFLLGELYVDIAQVSSFEGLAGYTVVFLFALPGMLVGAVIGAVLGWRAAGAGAGRLRVT